MESHEFARVSEKGVKNQGGVITLNLLLIHDQNTYFFFYKHDVYKHIQAQVW